MLSRYEILFLLCLGNILTELPAVSGCSEWDQIDPSDYSTTYILPNNAQANSSRPLGYLSATVEHGETIKPCVIVKNTTGNGRHIALFLDIGDTGEICVDGQCSSKRDYRCKIINAPSKRYDFYCRACEGTKVTFWFRIILESPTNSGYDENWCSTLSADYPSGLKNSGGVIIPTPPGMETTSGTPQLQPLNMCIIFVTCVLHLFHVF